MNVIVETPLMKQYYEMKRKYPDAIMLFRVGDFYETFDEDARKTSKILGITLTKRANGSASYVDLAGFPYHALDSYMPKLVRAGERVAICEQLEDPKKTKTIVKRGVTELITPGVALSDNILENRENNFLASVYIDKTLAGVAMLDYSTGEFFTTEGTLDFVSKILASFNPKEVLYDKNKYNQYIDAFGNKYYSYPLEDWVFTEKTANERLLSLFGTKNLKGFGVEDLRYGVIAAGAILEYLKITRHGDLNHIQKINRIDQHEHVWLDRFTITNLEIFKSISYGGRTLIDVIDHTASPMGARNLKRWLSMPLINPKKINDRLDVVEYLINNQDVKNDIFSNIFQIGDLERLLSKISALKVNPRELLQLKNSLELIEPIKSACDIKNNPILSIISEQLNPCKSAIERIAITIHSETPNQVSKGGVIAVGISEELDDLRSIAYSGKDYLVKIQQDEIARTGINSLKIGFNSVFGYYFEVRNTYKDQVPSDWTRKQTLTGAERYINQELKEYESKILGAEEKILSLETEIYNNLVISLCEYIPSIQLNASMIANLDCLINFASIAIENEYVKPIVDDSYVIDIKAGRHPVIEKQLPISEKYIPNDVFIDNETQQIIIITGPNMAGKSALLRQTALITLMAQIGSYVPASDVRIGYVDKIFTRVGASDNISGGESTFMVEMTEASNILNNLTNRSLILFDELGRGTSTYDGISIAWSICEYLHENSNKAKTLFATHYHELNELEADFQRIKNYNVSVKEIGSDNPSERKIIFLRKLQKGGSNHSFGIHVAQIAGMPKSIVNRANEVLKELEGKSTEKQPIKNVKDIAHHRQGYQLSIFQLDDPLVADIRKQIENIDVNNITPIEALNKLDKIKNLLGKH